MEHSRPGLILPTAPASQSTALSNAGNRLITQSPDKSEADPSAIAGRSKLRVLNATGHALSTTLLAYCGPTAEMPKLFLNSWFVPTASLTSAVPLPRMSLLDKIT